MHDLNEIALPIRSSSGHNSLNVEKEVLPYHGKLECYARSLTRDRSTADDLIQDTYLQAYRGFHTFQKGTSCGAWLKRICRNLFIDRLRKNRRTKERASLENVEPWLRDPSYEKRQLDLQHASGIEADASELPLPEMVSDELAENIRSLPREFSKVVLLSDLWGLTYKEIQEFIGVPVGTVRSRLSRGRAMLRSRLSGYVSEAGFGTA